MLLHFIPFYFLFLLPLCCAVRFDTAHIKRIWYGMVVAQTTRTEAIEAYIASYRFCWNVYTDLIWYKTARCQYTYFRVIRYVFPLRPAFKQQK